MPTKDNDAPLSAEDMLADAPDEGQSTDAVAAEEPRLHPILTNAEFRAAQEKARKRVEDDAKKDATKAVEQQAYDEMRGRSGLRTGDPIKDELVFITLDLAEHSDCIRINGHEFWHGHTYRLPRHVCDSLKEIQSRGWAHQDEIDGKGKAEAYRQPRNTLISEAGGATINAPQRAA